MEKCIRRFEMVHVSEAYLSWLNDPEVVKYMSTWSTTYTFDELVEYARKTIASDKNHMFAIFAGEMHIGNVKLSVNTTHHYADVGIMVGSKEHWGRGYAKRAISEVVDHAFKELKLKKLTAGMVITNRRSLGAFLSNNFQIEGYRRSHWQFAAGRSDYVELGLLRTEWNDERSGGMEP